MRVAGMLQGLDAPASRWKAITTKKARDEKKKRAGKPT